MMPQESRLTRSAVDAISIAFDIDEPAIQNASDVLNAIRTALLSRIVYLLNTNPEKLMSVLYRIDVSETKLKEIFSNSFPPDIPDKLVDLVIERQLSKAITRRAATRKQKG